jgi:hypothetical protein
MSPTADDRQKRIKALAVRVALSKAFQEFYNSKDAPEVWEKLVATWDDETMHTIGLVLDEEDAMRKDLAMETMRKNKVNETQLLQRIEQLRIKAHESNPQTNG